MTTLYLVKKSTFLDSGKTSSECTIMIDDALPPKSLQPREANVMYYHRKVCGILRQPRDRQLSDIGYTRTAVEKDSEEAMDADGDLIICEDNFEPSKENLGDLGKDVDIISTNLNANENREGNQFATDLKCQDKGSNKTNHFTYSLWTFGGLNLLIRTTDCGFLYQANKAGKGSFYPVNVFVKPEYQLIHGYEQITTSEASRWWLSTYINPDSLCLCARTDPVTAQLVKLDIFDQSNILTLSSFDPAKPMKMIHGILSRLEKLLKPGKYILSHSANDMHICVYEVIDDEKGGKTKNASYNLHLAHSKEVLLEYEKHVPWVPLDPNMFLHWQVAHNRIPLTFPPTTRQELKKIQEKNAVARKKKTKKGKKGKDDKTSGDVGKLGNKSAGKHSMNTRASTRADNEKDLGMALRLRSRVTYDENDFDF